VLLAARRLLAGGKLLAIGAIMLVVILLRLDELDGDGVADAYGHENTAKDATGCGGGERRHASDSTGGKEGEAQAFKPRIFVIMHRKKHTPMFGRVKR
jgi:hypothetical protein